MGACKIDEIRPEVLWFARQMEAKLLKYDSKRGDCWMRESPKWLVERLQDECIELERSINEWAKLSNRDKKMGLSIDVCKEASDVANFAMMIAYVVCNSNLD